MAQSESLRNRFEQHRPKNLKSKIDDKRIYTSMLSVQLYLERKFGGTPEEEYESTELDYSTISENIIEANEIAIKKHPASIDEHEKSSYFHVNGEKTILSRGGIDQYKKYGYYIEFEKSISINYMIENIREKGIRKDFDFDYIDRKIIPDGGVLFLRKKSDPNYKKVLLISEVKRQGTNDQRKEEGKAKQATGNAIERLGKNLIGIKTMMNHEKITPFVVFGWGVDFDPTEKTVLSKLSTLNEFYPLNKTYVNKVDGSSDFNFFSPTSFYFRVEQWKSQEMFNIMIEIAEASMRYYIY